LNDHLLLCSAPSCLKWRHTFFTALKKERDRLFTDPPLQDYLLTTLQRVLEGQQIAPRTGQFTQIAASQTKIGWLCLFHGFWSSTWLDEHLRRVNEFPLRSPREQTARQKHQDRWLHNVNAFIVGQCHKLWLLRNTERHGVTPAERAACLRITTERELARLYNSRPFSTPLLKPTNCNPSGRSGTG
jgi:hypothetical protein